MEFLIIQLIKKNLLNNTIHTKPENFTDLKIKNDSSTAIFENFNNSEETKSLMSRNLKRKSQMDMGEETEDDTAAKRKKFEDWMDCAINLDTNSEDITEQVEESVNIITEKFEEPKFKAGNDCSTAINENNYSYAEENSMTLINQKINCEEDMHLDLETEDDTSTTVNNEEKIYQDHIMDSAINPERKSEDIFEKIDIVKIINRNSKNLEEYKNDSKRTIADRSPHFEIVLDALGKLNKRNGTSVEEIISYLEQNSQINVSIKRTKLQIKRLLQKGVANGLIDVVRRNGTQEKFKVRITENNERGIEKTNTRKNKKRPTNAKKVSGRVKKN